MSDTKPTAETQPCSIAEVLGAAMWSTSPASGLIHETRLTWAAEIVERLRAAGYAIVPLEPTRDMTLEIAGTDLGDVEDQGSIGMEQAAAFYRAMVGAAAR